MKIFLTVLFLPLTIISLAQTTDPQPLATTFFTKGQEWEYANFAPKLGLFGKRDGYFEITRFTYKVTAVTDSNGVAISNISKTGTAANDDFSWQRNFTVRADHAFLSLPVDYYLMDTVYLCDAYGKWHKPTVYSDLHVTGDPLQYPIAIDSTTQLNMSGYQMECKIYDPQRTQVMQDAGVKILHHTYQFKANAAETSRRVVGTARITTQAGTFACYRIHIELELDGGPIRKEVYEEYYNPAVGIVKIEAANGGYMELVRVKKKK